MKIVFTFLLILMQIITIAQIGCTDFRANNYNTNAIINDGSCTYNYTLASLQYLCKLDSAVIETSGLVKINNDYWTHNDSDNPNKLYKINTINGVVEQTLKVANATNIDWEEITASNNHLFIADFGNNNGVRTDLKIYKCSKNIISTDTIINTSTIPFSYDQQTTFAINSFTNFDAEAFIHFNDSLYIFTKQWGNRFTKIYQLSTDTVLQIAKILDSFNIQGLISGAAISQDYKTICLLGYDTNGKSFIWLLWDFNGNNFFGGNKRRIDFGFNGGQCEAITFIDNDKIMISNESYSVLVASLQSLNISSWIGSTPLQTTNNTVATIIFDAFNKTIQLPPNHSYQSLNVFNMQGQLLHKQMINGNYSKIKFPNFNNGNYILDFCSKNHHKMHIVLQ